MIGTEHSKPSAANPDHNPNTNHLITLPPCHPVTLVIGYGNDLRGDDAVGPLAAAAVTTWDMPGVQALAVHQLMPELAETLAAADTAIFVDARVPAPSPDPCPPSTRRAQTSPALPGWESGLGGEGAETVTIDPVEPAAAPLMSGHTGDPCALLALTKALYDRYPRTWSITVPARSFAFGADLSPAARRGLAMALEQVRDLIHESRSENDRAR